MRPAFLAADSRADPGRAVGRLACLAGRRLVTGGHSPVGAGHVVTAGRPGRPGRRDGCMAVPLL